MIRVRRRGTARSTPLVVLAMCVATLAVTPIAAHAIEHRPDPGHDRRPDESPLPPRKDERDHVQSVRRGQGETRDDHGEHQATPGQREAKRAGIKVTQKSLVNDIVRAYVLGASDAQILALFNQNATQIGARNGLRGRGHRQPQSGRSTPTRRRRPRSTRRFDWSASNARTPDNRPTRCRSCSR